VELLSEDGVLLGSLEPLVPSSGGALAKVRQVRGHTHAQAQHRAGRQGLLVQGPFTAAAGLSVAPTGIAPSNLVYEILEI
jgi:hypothetical protein